MSIPTLIIGGSGSGKSAALRNMNPAEVLLVQSIPKPLPFPNSSAWQRFDPETKKGNIFVTDKSTDLLLLLQKTSRKCIVIDDFQYVMSYEFMRRSDERGYDKFTEIGRHAWDVLCMAGQLSPETRVYVLAHNTTGDDGPERMKTIGRMLDEKITVEGMFTMVLKTVVRDGEYFFATHNSGHDVVKSPMGLFEEDLVPNDLQVVDEAVCRYYNIY